MDKGFPRFAQGNDFWAIFRELSSSKKIEKAESFSAEGLILKKHGWLKVILCKVRGNICLRVFDDYYVLRNNLAS